MAHQGIFVLAILSIVISLSSAADCDQKTHWHCKDERKCILKEKWCDGNKDCDDGSDEVCVSDVAQNYEGVTNDKVVNQITLELQASYIYQGYASYFQRADVALPGVQKFFAAAALEEREHAQMLIDYINERGGNNQFNEININSACKHVKDHISEVGVQKLEVEKTFCICAFVATEKADADKFSHCKTGERDTWKNALNAFHDALILEKFVNQKLLQLHKEAEAKKDAHLAHLVEHQLLDEQVKSIYQLASYVTRLKSFDKNYQLGEYLFDQRLK